MCERYILKQIPKLEANKETRFNKEIRLYDKNILLDKNIELIKLHLKKLILQDV